MHLEEFVRACPQGLLCDLVRGMLALDSKNQMQGPCLQSAWPRGILLLQCCMPHVDLSQSTQTGKPVPCAWAALIDLPDCLADNATVV